MNIENEFFKTFYFLKAYTKINALFNHAATLIIYSVAIVHLIDSKKMFKMINGFFYRYNFSVGKYLNIKL